MPQRQANSLPLPPVQGSAQWRSTRSDISPNGCRTRRHRHSAMRYRPGSASGPGAARTASALSHRCSPAQVENERSIRDVARVMAKLSNPTQAAPKQQAEYRQASILSLGCRSVLKLRRCLRPHSCVAPGANRSAASACARAFRGINGRHPAAALRQRAPAVYSTVPQRTHSQR